MTDRYPWQMEISMPDPLLRVGPGGRALAFNSIADIVDLDRYPLHDVGSASVDALIREGQAALKRDALFSLPGFVRPEAAAFMAGEIEARVGMSCRYEADRTSYNSDGNRSRHLRTKRGSGRGRNCTAARGKTSPITGAKRTRLRRCST